MTAISATVPAVAGADRILIPSLPSGVVGVIASTVNVLAEYTPIVIPNTRRVKPIVADALEALCANPSTMPEQIAKLRETGRLLDGRFADALAQARAEDAAADAAPKRDGGMSDACDLERHGPRHRRGYLDHHILDRYSDRLTKAEARLRAAERAAARRQGRGERGPSRISPSRPRPSTLPREGRRRIRPARGYGRA